MPIEFKKYFWDTDFEKLDIKMNIQYIVSRLFCLGDIPAIKWLKSTYSREELIECIKKTRQLDPITANYLRKFYELSKEEMTYYKNIQELNYEYMR